MSQKLISNSVARMKILISSSTRLGETPLVCFSSSSIRKSDLQTRRPELTYLSLTGRLPYSRPQRSSRSISSTGCRGDECSSLYTVVWLLHRTRSNKARGQLGGQASPPIDPRQGCICCKQCTLVIEMVIASRRDKEGRVYSPFVSGVFSISALDNPKDAQ